MDTPNARTPSVLLYGIEERPPLREAFFAALQHLLAIFIAIVTPPLIIAGALGLDHETTGFLVSMALFASGLSTFIQCRRIGGVGTGLLCIQGTSFSFIGPIISTGMLGGLPLIFGVCIAAAPVEMVISRLLRYTQKVITPLVSGIVVTLIGMSLIKVGIIACGGAPLEWVEQQVAAARKITDKPIGANVMLMDPNAAELARLLVDLKIDVVTTGAGSPANYMDMWKEAGIKVVPVVATTALAKRMERLGADAVVAEGTESGGHVGELTTMALVPAVCDTVSIPVIAAGGIADGRGVAAAFALGAEGVQMGTRFLTVEECTVSDAYKERVLAAKDSDTIVTGRGSGHPVRCLKNKFSRNVRKLEADLTKNGDELEAMYVGSLRRAVEGDVDNGSMMAGQVAALVHERKTAQEVIDELMAQAQAVGARTLQQAADANAVRG